MDLSLEQELNVRSFESSVKRMSKEQAQSFLIDIYKQMLLKDNYYKNLLKNSWGIDSPKE